MDRRTKRQKLQAMADQSVSPHEAEIAQRLLEELPPDPPVDPFVFAHNGMINFNGIGFKVNFNFGGNPPDIKVYDFSTNTWKNGFPVSGWGEF